MRRFDDRLLDSRWPAVVRLIDRWAALPAASWHLLIDAEQVRAAAPAPGPPRDYTQWMLRDLVQTAWWMATRRAPVADAPWTDDARAALERVVRQLLDARADAL